MLKGSESFAGRGEHFWCGLKLERAGTLVRYSWPALIRRPLKFFVYYFKQTVLSFRLIGSLSNHDGDDNGNVKKQ